MHIGGAERIVYQLAMTSRRWIWPGSVVNWWIVGRKTKENGIQHHRSLDVDSNSQRSCCRFLALPIKKRDHTCPHPITDGRFLYSFAAECHPKLIHVCTAHNVFKADKFTLYKFALGKARTVVSQAVQKISLRCKVKNSVIYNGVKMQHMNI